MVSKSDLKRYANALMFEMDDKEYDTLLYEFDVLLKQMDIIALFEGIEDVIPMSFPFKLNDVLLRSDEEKNMLSVDEVLSNCKSVKDKSVMLPKVVVENE